MPRVSGLSPLRRRFNSVRRRASPQLVRHLGPSKKPRGSRRSLHTCVNPAGVDFSTGQAIGSPPCNRPHRLTESGLTAAVRQNADSNGSAISSLSMVLTRPRVRKLLSAVTEKSTAQRPDRTADTAIFKTNRTQRLGQSPNGALCSIRRAALTITRHEPPTIRRLPGGRNARAVAKIKMMNGTTLHHCNASRARRRHKRFW